MKLLIVALSVLLTVGLYGCQSTPTRTSGSVEVEGDNARVRIVFSDHDRDIIHRYYSHAKPKKMPPGLAKKKHLPPGLQKQLRRHGKLPPGLEGRYLPHDLERQLRPLPNGYVRVRVGADILLMDGKTRIILDILTGVAL